MKSLTCEGEANPHVDRYEMGSSELLVMFLLEVVVSKHWHPPRLSKVHVA